MIITVTCFESVKFGWSQWLNVEGTYVIQQRAWCGTRNERKQKTDSMVRQRGWRTLKRALAIPLRHSATPVSIQSMGMKGKELTG